MLRFEMELQGADGGVVLYKSFNTLHRGYAWGAARRWLNQIKSRDLVKDMNITHERLTILN